MSHSLGNFGYIAPVISTTDQKEIDLTQVNSPVSRGSLMTLLGYSGTEKLHLLEAHVIVDNGTDRATFKRTNGIAYPYNAPDSEFKHGGNRALNLLEECDDFEILIPAGCVVTAYVTVALTGVISSLN
jgi:hypothetical protein